MTFFLDDVVRTQPFSSEHFVYMTLAVIACVWFIRKQATIKSNQEHYHKLFLWLILVPTVIFYIWSLIFTGFGLPNGLPLHACRISTLLSLYYFLTKDQRVFPYLYYFGIFAVVAIAYTSNVHPLYTHLVGYTSQITHIMLLITWLYIVLVVGYRPTIKDFKQVGLHFSLFLLLIWPFNHLVGGGEYFYILSEVNRPFLKDLPEVLWVSGMILLMLLAMSLKTLPFYVRHLPPFIARSNK
jgi:hypothetical integral membrane protein (TIGR02206 family)